MIGARGSATAYGLVARSFHWVVALLFFGLAGVGKYMAGLDYADALRPQLVVVHRSLGLTLAVLVVLRILWMLADRRPAPLPHLKRWEKNLSATVHFLLYVLLLAIPVVGYLFSGASGNDVELLLGELPSVMEFGKAAKDLLITAHERLTFLVLGLVILHVAGVVKHHLVDKIPQLRRML